MSRHLVALGLLTLMSAVTGGAEPGEPRPAPSSYPFRRVYVAPTQIPGVDGVYVPVRREQFENQLGTLRSKELATGTWLETSIWKASYTARLEGDSLLSGTARLSFLHRAPGPGIFLLEPCSLFLQQPVWHVIQPAAETGDRVTDSPPAQEERPVTDPGLPMDAAAPGDPPAPREAAPSGEAASPAESPPPRESTPPGDSQAPPGGTVPPGGDGPSSSGSSPLTESAGSAVAPGGSPGSRTGSGGQPASVPARLGVNDAEHLALIVPASGELEFAWSLRGQRTSPDASRFSFRMPPCPATQIQLDLPADLRPEVEPGFVRPAAEQPLGDGYVRWSIDLGGEGSTELNLVPRTSRRTATQNGTVRQVSTYRITPQGIELQADLQLDVSQQALELLTLELDAGLQMIAATIGDTPLRWTDSLVADRPVVIVEFPEPLTGNDRTVRVRALAPLVLGRRWRLPTVRPTGVLWLEGTVGLVIQEPLLLNQLYTTGCRQAAVPPLPGPEPSESLQIQCFEPRASIELVVDRREGRLTIRSGNTVRLGRNLTTAVLVADLESTAAAYFQVTLDVGRDWTIDQVETLPADRLESWDVLRPNTDRREVLVRLREPLAPQRPIQLIVHAHARGLRGDERMSGDVLRLGLFRGATVERALVSLSADSPGQVALRRDVDLTRRAASELTDADKKRITLPVGGVLYEDGATADLIEAELRNVSASCTARIHVEAEVGEKRLGLVYRLQVRPETSAINQVTVHFFEVVDDPPIWFSPGQGEASPAARRLSEDEQRRAGIADGETWEISLPQPQEGPFEIVATRWTEFDGDSSVPLVSLLESQTQVGTLTIRCADGSPLRIEPQNLRTVPAEPPAPGQYTPIRAVYRYDPSQDSRVTITRPPPPGEPPAAWIWSSQLWSQYYRDGQAVHRLRYRIENLGAQRMHLELPPLVQWLSVRVDGREMPLTAESGQAAQLAIELRRPARFPTVEVAYVVADKLLGLTSEIRAPWPKTDLPSFQRFWTVRLPPGLRPRQADGWDADIPWQQRLFGPLWREPGQLLFHPLSADSWPSWSQPRDPDHGPAVERYDRFLAALGCARGETAVADAAGRATWGESLTRCSELLRGDEPGGPVPIYVDSPQLAEAGVTPWTPLPGLPAPSAGDTEIGETLLQQARLVVLACGDFLVLTRDDGGERLRAEPGPRSCLGIVRRDEDRNSLRQDAVNFRILPVAGWVTRPLLPQTAWQDVDAWPSEEAGSNAWNTYHVDPGPSPAAGRGRMPESRLMIYQPEARDAMGWAVFLMVAGLSAWILRRRPLLGLPLLAVSGGLALLAPAMWGRCFTAGFLATIVVVLWAWYRDSTIAPGRSRDEPGATRQSSLIARATSFWLAWGLAFFCTSFDVAAAEPSGTAAPAAASPPTFPVLCPIDANRQPWGDYVFVPRPFYEALQRETMVRGPETQRWLIHDAAYRAVMQWNAAEDELSVSELSVVYQLEVFQPAARVLLPMRQEQVYLLPLRSQLDGSPASVVWDSGGRGLSIELDSPGPHELQLAFRPQVTRSEEHDSILVDIPRVPGARLIAEVPADAQGLTFPATAGGVVRDEQLGAFVASLGPAPQLTLRWPAAGTTRAAPDRLEVSQLMWLQVRSGAVTLETKFRFTALSGEIRHVDLLADPRLRLLPADQDAAIANVDVKEGRPTAIHLDLAPPHAREVDINLRFAVTSASGTGLVLLPALAARADRVTRAWLAVTVDPELEATVPPVPAPPEPPPPAPGLKPADFLAAWGDTPSGPQLVADLLAATPAWSLMVRPRDAAVKGTQQLELACGAQAVDFRLTASLEMVQGIRFQYRIGMPRDAVVTSVTVWEDNADRVQRWSRDDQGLVVRLDPAVSRAHRLEVSGRLPVPRPLRPGTAIPISGISLLDTPLDQARIEVFRRWPVQAQAVRPAEATEVADLPAESDRPGWGRWVAAWEQPSDRPSSPFQLTLSPNRPRTAGSIATFLQREADGWWAEAECALRITDGALDALRFEIPADWTAPFTVDIPAQIDTAEIAASTRHLLTVRPERPLAKNVQLRIRGKLQASARERVRVPDIVPLDVEQMERFVVVPTRIDQQAIIWETSGLQSASLSPQHARGDMASAATYVAYRDRFQAVIKDIQIESGEPRVHLADYLVMLESADQGLGFASFAVEPAGRSQCQLDVPDGCQPLLVTVAGLPTASLTREGSRWSLPLGPQQLPQLIRVVFRSRPSGTPRHGEVRRFPVPSLSGFRPDAACWTVAEPADGSARVVVPGEEVERWVLDRQRLLAIDRLMAGAQEVLRDSDTEALERWYSDWLRRRNAARSWLIPREASSGSAPAPTPDLETSDLEQISLAETLGMTDRQAEAAGDEPRALEPQDLWRLAAAADRPMRRWVARQHEPESGLDVVAVPPPADGRLPVAAITFLCLALAAMPFLPNPGLGRLVARTPHLLGLVLGLAWWMWLTPSALGCAICCISLVGWCLAAMARRRQLRLAGDATEKVATPAA